MIDGFDKDGFILWVNDDLFAHETYNRVTYSIIESVVDYGLDHCNVSKGQLCQYLYDVLGDNIRLGEICAFADAAILTEEQQAEKETVKIARLNLYENNVGEVFLK